jgi:hypothetical protein
MLLIGGHTGQQDVSGDLLAEAVPNVALRGGVMARHATNISKISLPDEAGDTESVDEYISTCLAEAGKLEFRECDQGGLQLLDAASLDPTTKGPYKGRSFLEATSTILNNLLVLQGVRWMLVEFDTLFDRYTLYYTPTLSNFCHIRAVNGADSLDARVAHVNPVTAREKICNEFSNLRVGPTARFNIVVANKSGVYDTEISRIERFMISGEQLVLVDIGSVESDRPAHVVK